ncbi:MAG TPA: hypothetical protein VFT04_12490 [Gemmatimonadales bacterium]|nr:hypothetical protein [Gemmatimonadales bacterium]
MSTWVAASRPAGHRTVRFRWQLQDDRGAAGGRGTARIAAPDSVRLDVVGPLGAGRGAAVVVGDSARWTDPPDIIERLVPSYPLMWAMFGVERMPPSDAALRGSSDSAGTAWQWAAGSDTVTYLRRIAPARLIAESRQAGRIVGRVETELGPDGRPTISRLTVPSVPARLTLTFTASAPSESFPPDLWRAAP